MWDLDARAGREVDRVQKPALNLRQVVSSVAVFCVVITLCVRIVAQSGLNSNRERSLSNLRAIALAALAYTSDHDDVLPLTAGMDEQTRILRWNYTHRVAAGWQADGFFNTPQRIREDSQMWANSLLPYIPNPKVYEQPGVTVLRRSNMNYNRHDRAVPRLLVGVAYNGILHGWERNAIAVPGKLPLFSQHFAMNGDGWALSMPQIWCQRPAVPCKFHPERMPQPGTPGQYGGLWFFIGEKAWTVWVYDSGMNFVSADARAYWVLMKIPNHPAYVHNVNYAPWNSLDPEPSVPIGGLPGGPRWMTYCVAPGKVLTVEDVTYPGYYRPDSEFEYERSSCDYPH